MNSVYVYEKLRYGIFVHYIAGQGRYQDGRIASNINETADNFDVPHFVDDILATGAEYVIFTAWHNLTIPLYPSEVTKKWRPGRYIRRDLIGEIIDGLLAHGIKTILYTHPRDGHDFQGEERVRCGWGEGCYNIKTQSSLEAKGEDLQWNMEDTPNPKTFSYKKWNQYTVELYQELAECYGSRIIGIWTDGMGPGRFMFDTQHSYPYKYPVVNYIDIRKALKKVNPDAVMIQNAFGFHFSDDYVMTESFFGFETTHKDLSDWPACEKATAFCFSSAGWAASGNYGKTQILIDCHSMAKYIIFQATCASAGGTCLAAGPYCGGGWDVGVAEYMREVGHYLKPLGDSIKNIVRSTSWPTISGDNMKSKNYIAACSSGDRVYEYIHILRYPEDGIVYLPQPEDRAVLTHPCALTPGVKICDYKQTDNGVSFNIEGEFNETDTVIRLRRENNTNSESYEWRNDGDKRISYRVLEDWTYDALKTYDNGIENVDLIGCYDADLRCSSTPGARFDTCFEGQEIELYASVHKNGGSADILIDDICMLTISTKSEERHNRVQVFKSGTLYGGIHTFSVIVKDGTLLFDALRIRK